MSQATPELLITNDGLAVASVALPQGPYIHIAGFKIGSAFGYDPDRSQQSLRGTELYSDQVQAWNNVGDNTIDIVCRIQPEAGPFQFGEVGLYLADANGNFSDQSVLFAIAVFDEPQTKFSSLGTNVVSSYTFHCLLKLEQSTAVFKIDTAGGDPAVVDQFCWSDVYPPSLSANPNVQIYNVKEGNSRNADGTLLATTTDGHRSFVAGAYSQLWSLIQTTPGEINFTVANASSTYIEVPLTQFGASRVLPNNRAALIQTAAGFWRSVQTSYVQGPNVHFVLNASNDGTYNNYPLPIVPAAGERVFIYTDYAEGRSILYEQIIDPPPIPLAQPGVPGLATSGNGLRLDSPGVISGYGMLQDGQNTGGNLGGNRDLNENLPSGVYWMADSSVGPYALPRNMPFSYPANLYNHNIVGAGGGSDLTQILYPWNTGGGDAQGNGGLPPYWRQGYTNNGVLVWTNWFPVLVNGKQGFVQGTQAVYTPTLRTNTVNITLPSAGNWQISGWYSVFQAIQTAITFYINGTQVAYLPDEGDPDGIEYVPIYGTLVVNVSGPTSIQVNGVTSHRWAPNSAEAIMATAIKLA